MAYFSDRNSTNLSSVVDKNSKIYNFVDCTRQNSLPKWVQLNFPFSHIYEYLFSMTYGYIRVSTDKQTVENQRYEIEQFCKKNNLHIDSWIEETISGTLTPDKRELGTLLAHIQQGDLIISSELSRLGRSLFMIMSILNLIMEKGARIWTIKDNYRLGDDIQSKVLAFAFGLSAEIERNLISQRTKEALQLRKAQNIKLGRPLGRKSSHRLMDGLEFQVQTMHDRGMSVNHIAKFIGVSRNSVNACLKEKKEA